jgi:hypothetical protein
MIFTPARTKGLLLGGALLILLLAGMAAGIFHLSTGRVTPLLGIWTAIVILCCPLAMLVAYQLYGLITAYYTIDRNGFTLRWGLATEQIPLAAILGIIKGSEALIENAPGKGSGLLGWRIGHRAIPGLGSVEFFTTSDPSNMILLKLKGRNLAISPSDMEGFEKAFYEANRLGALRELPERSQRPDFFSARLWKDHVARVLILLSLLLLLILLGYIAYRLPSLPDLVPFGFDREGRPDTLVPPAQLLLLPLVGGFFWLLDSFLGAWFFRRDTERRIAYFVWGVGLLMSILFCGAVWHLLRAA